MIITGVMSMKMVDYLLYHHGMCLKWKLNVNRLSAHIANDTNRLSLFSRLPIFGIPGIPVEQIKNHKYSDLSALMRVCMLLPNNFTPILYYYTIMILMHCLFYSLIIKLLIDVNLILRPVS